jgi:quercetin dioxygenase-like cupin family protein
MTTLRHQGGFTWENVSVLKYKEEGTHFKAITRQILFDGNEDLPGQLRYFEVAPGGYSTLERHHHEHVVMVIRGAGKALIGAEVISLDRFDVVHIPPRTWHQFQPAANETLGFLCLVNVERDKPERPNEAQLHEIKSNAVVAQFIKT